MQLFISDLHLHASRPEVTGLFLDFLAGPAREARQLFILGDLFEYWAGDDDIGSPPHEQVGAALKSLCGDGIDLSFLPGNRDFLVNGGFCEVTGARLLDDPCVESVAGTPTLLLHGDTLCTDDIDYQSYRRQVRNPDFISNFLSRPLVERKRYIENLRERSEAEKGRKDLSIMDVNGDAVCKAFRDAGVTRMIHGHTHRLALHRYEIDGKHRERWVLGDWNVTGNFLECGDNGCRYFLWDGKHATVTMHPV